MTHTRKIASAFLFIIAVGSSGCGATRGEKEPCFPRLNALFCGNRSESMAGYPEVVGSPECSTCSNGVPYSGPIVSGPMMVNPPGTGGGMTPQPPFNNAPTPKIPPVGIKESDGKQFELESKAGTGPVLAVPAGVVGTKR